MVKIKDAEWNGGCQGLGGGEVGSCAVGAVSVLQGKTILEMVAQ